METVFALRVYIPLNKRWNQVQDMELSIYWNQSDQLERYGETLSVWMEYPTILSIYLYVFREFCNGSCTIHSWHIIYNNYNKTRYFSWTVLFKNKMVCLRFFLLLLVEQIRTLLWYIQSMVSETKTISFRGDVWNDTWTPLVSTSGSESRNSIRN